MAYKILYSPEHNRRYPKLKKVKKASFVHAFWMLLLLLGMVWIKMRGIPDFMIPGNKEITTQAAEQIILNLRSGASIDAAITTFCKDIIHGAGF